MTMNPHVFNATSIVVRDLTADEVCALYMAVTMECKNLKPVTGYAKITSLLTEQGGAAMHEDTRTCFLALCQQRIGQM